MKDKRMNEWKSSSAGTVYSVSKDGNRCPSAYLKSLVLLLKYMGIYNLNLWVLFRLIKSPVLQTNISVSEIAF